MWFTAPYLLSHEPGASSNNAPRQSKSRLFEMILAIRRFFPSFIIDFPSPSIAHDNPNRYTFANGFLSSSFMQS